MAYEEVTSPILTDATGQEIVDKLEEIAQAVQPPTNIEASDVSYDNTQSGMTATDVQGAIDELKSNLTELETEYVDTSISGMTFRRCGSMVYCSFQKNLTTVANSFSHFATVPDGFKPVTTYYGLGLDTAVMLIANNTTTFISRHILIGTDGKMQIYAPNAISHEFRFSAFWFTNDNVPT